MTPKPKMLRREWWITTERSERGEAGRYGHDREGLTQTLRHLADRGDRWALVGGYEYGDGTHVDLMGLRS